MVWLLMAIVTWNAEETSFCNKEFILLEKVHCSIIRGLLPDKKFCYQLSQWKCLIISERKTDLQLFDYAIRYIMKKILY